MRLWLPLLALAPLLAACGDKSAIALSVSVADAQLSVPQSAFGGSLSGSFRLHLAVGPEASGSSTVTLGNFSLQNAAGASLVDQLSLTADPAFPVVVDKGGSKDVSFTIQNDTVDHDAICAGTVRIVGSVMDSLGGGTDPVQSLPITPDCGSAT